MKFHSEWCDLKNGGMECNCDAEDEPMVAVEKTKSERVADPGEANVSASVEKKDVR